MGDGPRGLSQARRRMSVDEWLIWVTGGPGSARCSGCGSGEALEGLEQRSILDLMAILVHGENPQDAAFQGVER
mgnify:CR=1 FL=1